MSYTLKQFMSALKPSGKVAADIGGQGITGSPAYLKLTSLGGTDYYIFPEDDATLKIHTAIPTVDTDGDEVGGQS